MEALNRLVKVRWTAGEADNNEGAEAKWPATSSWCRAHRVHAGHQTACWTLEPDSKVSVWCLMLLISYRGSFMLNCSGTHLDTEEAFCTYSVFLSSVLSDSSTSGYLYKAKNKKMAESPSHLLHK